MKLGPNGLMIDGFGELEGFFYSLNLNGILRLNEDLKDRQDKILIKEDIAVKQSHMDKLKEIRGAYNESFNIKLSSDLVEIITNQLLVDIEQYVSEHPLFHRLYEESGKKAFRYIFQALNHPRIAASAYILRTQSPEHFAHLCKMGILALGIALHLPMRLSRVHTSAFLIGFLSELPFPSRKVMLDAADNPPLLREVSEKASIMASRLDAPGVVIEAIRSTQAFSELAKEVSDSAALKKEGRQIDSMENVLFFEESSKEENSSTKQDDERLISALAEILKFTRYVFFLFTRLEHSEHMIEEVSFRVAYNARKGFFNMDIVSPVLKKFREYELEYRALMMIAEIEARCPYRNSAWAYPKPRATQIICRHTVTSCPHLQNGWDLHVISPQEAFGWIGASLDAGRYQKCDLEQELAKIPYRKKD
jgi:hypothetical protein